MTTQSGIFTFFEDPWTDIVRHAGRDYPSGDLDIARLIRWTVGSEQKNGIVLDLEHLAISTRKRFPDLHGLARGLGESEVIGSCFFEGRRSDAE